MKELRTKIYLHTFDRSAMQRLMITMTTRE